MFFRIYHYTTFHDLRMAVGCPTTEMFAAAMLVVLTLGNLR